VRAPHPGVITAASLNQTHSKLATCSASDDSVKVFDILNCDMITSLKLTYSPASICYIIKKDSNNELLAV